jgi:hypothetical protein
MSRKQKLKARDKVTLKNTRDGLVEHNAVTGEDVRVGSREADFDLRGEAPKREPLSQLGKRSQPHTLAAKPKRKQQHRHSAAEPITEQKPGTASENHEARPEAEIPLQSGPETGETPKSRLWQADQRHTTTLDSPESRNALKFSRDDTALPQGKPPRPKPPATNTAQAVQPGDAAHPAEPETVDGNVTDMARPESAPTSKFADGKPDTALTSDRPGKLQFAPDEATLATPKIHHNRKLNKAQKQADKAITKLEKAKAKLPAKKKLRSKRVFNEETGEAKRNLYFESEVKSQAQHIKGPLPLRPVKAAGNTSLAFGHRKMFQVEKENVGTEATHKGEMAVEGGVRSALRHHKTAPYRKAAKLERKSLKKSINLSYQKALAENPSLKSNPLARLWQKRKIRKDYAKAAREAQKAAKRAKKAGSVVADTGKATPVYLNRFFGNLLFGEQNNLQSRELQIGLKAGVLDRLDDAKRQVKAGRKDAPNRGRNDREDR